MVVDGHSAKNADDNTRLQTKFNCSDGHPDRAKQLLKYKTFVDRGKGKSNYEIRNLSRLRTKALQGRSRNGSGNRLPEVW